MLLHWILTTLVCVFLTAPLTTVVVGIIARTRWPDAQSEDGAVVIASVVAAGLFYAVGFPTFATCLAGALFTVAAFRTYARRRADAMVATMIANATSQAQQAQAVTMTAATGPNRPRPYLVPVPVTPPRGERPN